MIHVYITNAAGVKKKADGKYDGFWCTAIWLNNLSLYEAGHRALGKTLAVDPLVTVINPAVCVDATFPVSCCILVFSLTAERRRCTGGVRKWAWYLGGAKIESFRSVGQLCVASVVFCVRLRCCCCRTIRTPNQ